MSSTIRYVVTNPDGRYRTNGNYWVKDFNLAKTFTTINTARACANRFEGNVVKCELSIIEVAK